MCKKLWSLCSLNSSDHSVTTQRDAVTWCRITPPIYLGGLYNRDSKNIFILRSRLNWWDGGGGGGNYIGGVGIGWVPASALGFPIIPPPQSHQFNLERSKQIKTKIIVELHSLSQAYTSLRRILIQVLPVPNAYSRFAGICIGERKYLNEYTPYWSVSLCYYLFWNCHAVSFKDEGHW